MHFFAPCRSIVFTILLYIAVALEYIIVYSEEKNNLDPQLECFPNALQIWSPATNIWLFGKDKFWLGGDSSVVNSSTYFVWLFSVPEHEIFIINVALCGMLRQVKLGHGYHFHAVLHLARLLVRTE